MYYWVKDYQGFVLVDLVIDSNIMFFEFMILGKGQRKICDLG